MTDRNIKVGVEVDASSADQGLDKLANKAQSTSKIIKKAGEDAGQGFSKVGEGSEQASEKIDRTSKSIIQSIQRTTVALESGGRTTAKYYETIANQRGVSVDALRPYLEQLKAVETAQGKFTQSSGAAVNSLNNVGISANQTAAAMRNVPAQFTDIITSLQGGQAPLTVFLQQGGQLKDMFGGAGNAAKALGGYLVGLVNPFSILAVAAGGVAFAYAKGSKEASEFAKSIILTGNAAGTTTNELIQITDKLNAVGAGSKGLIAESLNTLISSGKLSSGILEEATMAAVGAQKILGIAVADTAKEFANLSKAPSAGLLNLVANYQGLTIEVYRQVKALEEQGRTSEAAILAQSSYARVLTDQKDAVENTLGRWERGWNRLKDATAGAIDKISEVGRESSRIDKLIPLLAEQRDLTSKKRSLGKSDDDRFEAGVIDSQLLGINARIKALAAEEKASVINTAAQDTANKKRLAGVEVEKLLEAALTKTEQKKIAIAKAEAQFAIADTKESERKKILASIEEKYADKSIKSIKEKAAAWDFQSFSIDKAGKIQTKALSDIDKSISAIKFPNALKQITDEFEKQTATFNRINAGLDEYAIGLQGQNELAQLELSLIGQSATERGILIEQYKIELALQKEIRKIKSEIKDAGAAQILIDKATSNAEIEKSQAAIKVQQQEWSKFYGDIYNGLTDSLYRGFEAGKGFFQSFWDGIKNLFKTTVLKLAVQGVVTGILGAGVAGTAAASNQLGTATNAFTTGKSLWDGFKAAGSIGGGISAGIGGSIAGFGNLVGSQSIAAFGSGLGMSTAAAGEAAALYTAAGNTAVAGGLTTGASINAALAAIPGWGWAALGAAAVAAAFGGGKDRVTGQQSISGMLGTNNISRDVPFTKSGGLLGKSDAGVWNYNLATSAAIASNGRSYTDTASQASDTAMLQQLNSSYAALQEAAKGYASILGLSADAVTAVSDRINFNLGKTKEETDAAMQAAFGQIANDITNRLSPAIASFSKEGEQVSATMARLAGSLVSVNEVLGQNGFTKFAQTLEGGNAAARLAELTGGIEKLATGAQYFFENFLTDAEKIKPSSDLVTDTMKRLGQSSVDTIAEFKTLIQGLDLASESGAKMYAELIAIAPQFKAVADYTSELTGALTEFESAAKAAADAAKLEADILSQRVSLQNEYNQLTMTSTELLALQRNEIYESNRALFDSISAVKQKREAEISAAEANKALTQTMIKNAELAQQILINAVDAERKVSQSVLESTLAILDSRKSASATVFETQKAILGASLSAAKSLASTLYSEANRIDGIAKSMVLADNQNNIGGSVFAAQAKLRSGDTSAETIKLATSSTQDMFASWADYAQNFFETKSLLQSSAAKAYSVAGEAMSQADAISAQLVAAEESYKSDLAHYAEQEKIARETMSQQTAYFDKIVSIAELALQEAQGTKVAVLSLPASILNANTNIQALSLITDRPAQLIPSSPTSNDLILAEIRDLLVDQGKSSEKLTTIMNDATNGGTIIRTVSV